MNLQLVYRNISSLSKMKICFTKKKKTNKQKEENFARARVELQTTDVYGQRIREL